MLRPAVPLLMLVVLPLPLCGEERVENWEGFRCLVTRDAEQPGQPVVGLDFIGNDLKDADLKKLARVKKTLKSLNLRHNGKVTDAGVKELACLEHLEVLFLPCTGVGDAALKELAPLERLRELSLAGTRVTDAGMKELTKRKGLRYLNLSQTAVTDAAREALQKALPDCKIYW